MTTLAMFLVQQIAWMRRPSLAPPPGTVHTKEVNAMTTLRRLMATATLVAGSGLFLLLETAGRGWP